MKTALIAGASGLTGKQCIFKCLESEAYSKVIALVRSKLHLKHPKLEQVVIDYEKPETIAIAADDVFCCLGTTINKAGSKEAFRKVDYVYPIELAKQTLAKGATGFFLVSAIGANKNSAIFYSRVKGELEQDLSALPFKTIAIVRPSLLMGIRSEFRLGERIAQVLFKPLSIFFVGPLSNYKPVKDTEVAQSLLQLATNNLTGVITIENRMIIQIAAAGLSDELIKK